MTMVQAIISSVAALIKRVFTSIKSFATSVWNGIKTAITTPIRAALNVINNIVFKKNVSADELFFDIWYTKTNNGKINSPYSLHYLIANKKLQAEYKKHLENKKPVVDIDTIAVSDEVTYTSKSKKSDFGGIF